MSRFLQLRYPSSTCMNMDAITFLSSSYLRNTHGSLSLHSKPLIAFDGEKAIDCKDTEVMVQKLKARLDVNAGTHIGIHYTLSISVFAFDIQELFNHRYLLPGSGYSVIDYHIHSSTLPKTPLPLPQCFLNSKTPLFELKNERILLPKPLCLVRIRQRYTHF